MTFYAIKHPSPERALPSPSELPFWGMASSRGAWWGCQASGFMGVWTTKAELEQAPLYRFLLHISALYGVVSVCSGLN